jgi:hypothetical protein
LYNKRRTAASVNRRLDLGIRAARRSGYRETPDQGECHVSGKTTGKLAGFPRC